MSECRDNTEFVNGQDEFNYCRTCGASLCNAGDAHVPNPQEGENSVDFSSNAPKQAEAAAAVMDITTLTAADRNTPALRLCS